MGKRGRKVVYDGMVGSKFGRLTVVSFHGKNEKGKYLWNCICDCGNEIVKPKDGIDLRRGNVKSCGCIRKEWSKHGLSKSKDELTRKIYKTWSSMRERCLNENHKYYKNYGGRGIKICDEWLDIKEGAYRFYEWSIKNGASLELSIDRIHNDSDYKPSNCRWVDDGIQNANKRNVRLIEINGESKSVSEWSRIYNMKYSRVLQRLKLGWDIMKALTHPIDSSKDSSKSRKKKRGE